MTFEKWMTIIPGLIGAITALVGVGLAVWGFDRWRREMIGKIEFDIARRLLLSVVRFERALKNAREDFSANQPEVTVRPIQDATFELRESHIEARVLWGSVEIDTAVAQLLSLESELNGAMFFLVRDAKLTGPKTENQQSRGYKCQNLIYGDDADHFGVRLTAAVKSLDAALGPYLPRKTKFSTVGLISKR